MMMLSRRAFAALAPLALLGCAEAAHAAAIHVYKSPTCGCCVEWVKHLRTSGFEVKVSDVDDLTPVARASGVPDALRSCHSALVEGYVVEGHVPASDIRRLLRERPKAIGIAVPGMPMGSPGMAQGGMKEAYVTLLFDQAGKWTIYARH